MKAIILCAGKGTRLRPLTFTIAKHLIPIANKPVIYYSLEKIKGVGIDEVGIVVNNENINDFKNFLGNGERFGLKIEYILQNEPKGLAHAVSMARDFIGNDDFLMYLGDNLILDDISQFVTEFRNDEKLKASILLSPVKDPSRFGIAIVNEGKIVKVVEKPKDPISNLAIIGLYLFRNTIFEGIDNIKPSWRGELEITDAIGYLIEKDYKVKGYIVYGWWKDTGKPEDLIEANRKILDDSHFKIEVNGVIDSLSEIQGRVYVGENTEVINSIIRGPVVIGNNCVIKDSYIGPYTSVGDGVLIESCELENSILMDRVKLINLPYPIDSSLIGKNVQIVNSERKPKAMKFVIGDMGKVEIVR
ncbi:glucose-1-phosphate thymidylyltransferase [Thermosipho melanesiensis]|uniref:Glucose-1-phosphate thymidyltransferase n=2 Tax=Thermosipho melanesiensis TaxID=46541 RepID=A6LL09_THEM4|nr:glucose-1-phosphate thymidylyltransferase [Thermosipho melanesiensis]ABR30610.1 glucose-1-phosphate thymidyltransferase [Thermosipho melanesiensis BI429]APT73750.1 glucose-1-phosphate thymidylyltransferase [Thermosipho melanesiensis]OOC35691.1 glucose-1-phosphate thymidylyltransferase [Thermosipho melanesiensis]OOC38990.1 glucose-1-phosphate thymidylyltransferase [Thermosipho melanesiensis]OOC39138.1 glucose-1-phosphate thymidylyltransferase [Thermosipho melanesiensis]